MVKAALDLRPRSLARWGLAVVIGGVLAWGIVVAGIGAYAARLKNPALLALFADQPDAGTKFGSLLLQAKQNSQARELAAQAVKEDPLNVRALTVLGLALEETGEPERAKAVLRKAASMGWRSTAVLLWALEDAARNDNPRRVVEIADALARREETELITRATFFASLDEPRLRRVFVERLAERPSWRAQFFADVGQRLNAKQLAGMNKVLSALQETQAPPTAGEMLIFVDRMVQLGEVGRARAYWASSFRIPAQSLLLSPFDGRFSRVAGAQDDQPLSAFEWQLNPDLQDVAVFVDDAGGPALRVDAGITGGATIISQVLALPPGSHILRTRLASGEGRSAPVGWTITCLKSDQPLLRRLARDGDELTQVQFEVPSGCQGQQLRLIALDRIDAQPVVISEVIIR